jgi:simple sugar transport system permease protein
MSGATVVLAQAGTFAEGMSGSRGFIALAVVALGRWHPVGVAIASLAFGAAAALQYLFQAMGVAASLALPYALTLSVLATGAGRRRAPAALPATTPR